MAIVRGQIDGYRDWLYAEAMLADVDLPSVELPPEVAHAAFSLVGYLEDPEQPHPQDTDEESGDEVQFDWDEPTAQIPKDLAALWTRAADPEQKVAMKTLLEAYPKIAGLPQKPPENNLCGEWKKRQDGNLKVLSQHVLHILRIWTHRYSKPESVNVNTDLQLWQYTAELYHKIQSERRELVLPGSSKAVANSSTDVLFTEDDVKKARTQQSIKDLNRKGITHPETFQTGGSSSAPDGQSFLSPTGGNKPWRGPGRPYQGGCGQVYPKFYIPFKGFGKGFKGGKGKGGKAKGVPSPQQLSHGDCRGLSHCGTVHSQGGKLSGQGGQPSSCVVSRGRPLTGPGPIPKIEGPTTLVAGPFPPVCGTAHYTGSGTHLLGGGLHFRRQNKSAEESSLALEIMEEYVRLGAAKEVDLKSTRYLDRKSVV